MGLASQLFKDPAAFILLTIPLLYSIIFHEVSHGYVAHLFGDDTAKRTGRLSLNPIVHLDPVGTLALFLIGFGWAKPVPVIYSNLKPFRLGLICVSLAGCLTNIMISSICILLLQIKPISSNHVLCSVLSWTAYINTVLGALNLIPIPPLDGSRILYGMLPRSAQDIMIKIEPYGMTILLVLLFTKMLDPIIIFMQNSVFTVIKFVLFRI